MIRPAVTVEPNNAGFAVPGGSVTYTHEVVNSGDTADSYALTLRSQLGYAVELIDPTTGTVIATDTNGDGVWDGGATVNTGTLNPGELIEYRVRVNVPLGTALGTTETTTLTATSDRAPALVSAFATDETTVIDTVDTGPVILIPDHSGVVAPGGSIAYTHTLTNNTGATDTFDLSAFPSQPGWTATIYNDSNGDGVYTPGIDVAIANSRRLADGELQTLFVVVTAPLGALPGQTDVASLTAISRSDPSLFDGASDTTTVVAAGSHDLSGGGTRLVDPGDIPVFPGTIKNLTGSSDEFDFTLAPSPFFGRDGLSHPTELWVDTNGDGTVDTRIGEDTDGDGDWDFVAAGFDTNGDGNPDVSVPGGAELAYELRRPVDPAMGASRDPVTLTTTARSSGEVDRVTATNLLAAATHAVLAGFEARNIEGRVVLEWSTASELGTVGFDLFRKAAGERRFRRVNQELIQGLLNAPQGGRYSYVDDGAAPGQTYAYRLVEQEVWGTHRELGRFIVWSDPDNEGVATTDLELRVLRRGHGGQAHRSGLRPQRLARLAALGEGRFERKLRRLPSDLATARLKVSLRERGLVHLSGQALGSAFGLPDRWVSWLVRRDWLRLHNQGQEVAWLPAEGGDGLYFFAEALDSIYTETNVYWVEMGRGSRLKLARGGRATPAPDQGFPESLHVEQEAWPVTSVIDDPEGDFWLWDYFYVAGASLTKSYTLETPDPTGNGPATLSVRLQGQADADVDPDHYLSFRLNGTSIGETYWDGNAAHTAVLSFDPSLLLDGANTVEVEAHRQPGVRYDFVYLDSFDIAYERRYRALDDRLIAPAAGHTVLTIDGFSAPEIVVLDVSDAKRPRRVERTRIESIDGGYRVSFETEAANALYLATTLAAAAAPLSVVVDQPSSLRASGHAADYVVIAGAGLEDAAEELAAYRRERGLSTFVAPIEEVYDEFSHGIVTPWAIRDFLAHTQQHWAGAPRYAVLAGDGSFDYNDRMGAGGNLLPPVMVSTPEGLFTADNRLADLEGDDGVPEIALGRIPAQTPEELSAYVAKLRARGESAGGWLAEALWVADNPDHGGEFTWDSDALLTGLPAGFNARRLYVEELGAPETRQRLLDGLRAGSGLVNYTGHGGLDRFADEGLLVTGDVPGLGNGPRYPVMLALTCVVGRYALPGYDGVGEALVLQEDGGSAALWGPTGASMNLDAVMIGAGFLRALTRPSPEGGPQTLGIAVRDALRDYVAEGGEQDHLPYVYTVLGDPAIEIGASER